MKKSRRNAKRLGCSILVEGGLMLIAMLALAGRVENAPFPSWTWIVIALTVFVLGQIFLIPLFVKRKMEKIKMAYIRAYRRGDKEAMLRIEHEAEKIDVFVDELENFIYPVR